MLIGYVRVSTNDQNTDLQRNLSTQLNNLQDTATSALSDIGKTVGGLLS